MTSTDPPAPPDASHHEEPAPVRPGPGIRWSGDGSLAPRRAPRWGSESPSALDRPGRAGAGEAQPRAQRVVGGVVDGMVLATLLRRLVCWLLDRVLKAIIFLVIVSIAGVEMAESPWASPELIVASALLNAGYDFVFGIQGITPAAYLMGLRIVALDGSEPGVRRSLLRASAASLNEVILFAGSVIALVDPRRQTMHDKIAGTMVIRTPRDR